MVRAQKPPFVRGGRQPGIVQNLFGPSTTTSIFSSTTSTTTTIVLPVYWYYYWVRLAKHLPVPLVVVVAAVVVMVVVVVVDFSTNYQEILPQIIFLSTLNSLIKVLQKLTQIIPLLENCLSPGCAGGGAPGVFAGSGGSGVVVD